MEGWPGSGMYGGGGLGQECIEGWPKSGVYRGVA